MAKGVKIPVSKAALMARINRALQREGSHLFKVRGQRLQRSFGHYYTVAEGNHVDEIEVDPVWLARKLGVLHPYEQAEGFYRTSSAKRGQSKGRSRT